MNNADNNRTSIRRIVSRPATLVAAKLSALVLVAHTVIATTPTVV